MLVVSGERGEPVEVFAELVIARRARGRKHFGGKHTWCRALEVKSGVSPEIDRQAAEFSVAGKYPPGGFEARQVSERLVYLFNQVERTVLCRVMSDRREFHEPENLQALVLTGQNTSQ